MKFGGPNGELSAAVRYLSQRYSMPTGRAKGVLTDIGTEELAHWEMIATMVYKLMKGATPEEIRRAGLGGTYAIWDKGIHPDDSNGVPWTSAYINTMGDPIADLHEDMAAEQKARATYENLINLTDDVTSRTGCGFSGSGRSFTSSASGRPWTTCRGIWTRRKSSS